MPLRASGHCAPTHRGRLAPPLGIEAALTSVRGPISMQPRGQIFQNATPNGQTSDPHDDFEAAVGALQNIFCLFLTFQNSPDVITNIGHLRFQGGYALAIRSLFDHHNPLDARGVIGAACG